MLLVIAIIAILAGIVIIAINPGRQLAQARNAQRSSDLRALHSAVQQYYIDNKSWPTTTTMPSELTEICDEGGEPSATCLNLNELVPTYLPAIPRDPSLDSTAEGTNYEMAINPTSLMPELTAPSSTEYQLEPVQVGTTTALGPLTNYCIASGGTETIIDGYKIHTFTTVGNSTFNVTSDSCDVEVMVVAGGGGGGSSHGGGGGAGGFIFTDTLNIEIGNYDVIVGNKGLGGASGASNQGTDGGDSSFNTLVSVGGGGGGAFHNISSIIHNGRNGGSGGGASTKYLTSPGTPGAGTLNQGNSGGSPIYIAGSGGGGSSSIGQNAISAEQGGNGGNGTTSNISGTTAVYAGGGGGGDWGGSGGLGGTGGGGDGGSYTGAGHDASGYGSGGGGGNQGTPGGGDGASGIVIVRYQNN